MLSRPTSAAFMFAVMTGKAWADVAPDPTDPTEPVGVFLYAIVAVALGGLGYLLYRMRRK